MALKLKPREQEKQRYYASCTEDPVNCVVAEQEPGRHPNGYPFQWSIEAGHIIRCSGHAPDATCATAIMHAVHEALMKFYRPGDDPGPLPMETVEGEPPETSTPAKTPRGRVKN